MTKPTLSLTVSCLNIAICSQLYAQDTTAIESATDSNKVIKLAPIVVTATRSAKSIADIAGTVYSIDRTQIEKQSNAGKTTADIIGLLVPSLTPGTGTGSNYGMSMRGRVVQYMIDGIPQTGYRDGSRQLNSISPAMIERIEVVSGASSIYGAGATGGIINIITRKGGDDPLSFETKIGVTSGDNIKSDAMSYEASQTMLFNQGDFKGSLGASYTKRGESQNSFGKRIGPEVAQSDRQDTETIDINGNITWNMDSNQSLNFGARYYDDKQNSEYGPDYGPGLSVLMSGAQPTGNAVKGLILDEQPQNKRYSFNAQYENRDLLGQTLNAEAYFRNEQARWFPSVSPIQHKERSGYLVFQSETDIDVWGARAALQSDFKVGDARLNLTYGVDYENEKDVQSIRQYDTDIFITSNGLNNQYLKNLPFGPDVQTDKLGLFLQTQFELSDRLSVQAGFRHDRVDSKVDQSIPYLELYVKDEKPDYQVRYLNGGEIKHNANLFNLGAVYHLTDAQQIFANFSQGSNLPDVQRMLRDVSADFVVNSQSIDPVKINNYELGWRIQANNGLTAGLTGFYNDSDKSLKFGAPAFNIEVIDTDERVYGAEANLSYQINSDWNIGGTAAYTRGQFKNAKGDWQELDAIRVAPLKATIYSDWQFDENIGLRIQALAIGGTDKANKDAVANAERRPAAEIKGFSIMDVITNAKVGTGKLSIGVYNVWNTEYKTIYAQSVLPVYGPISSLPAQGRTYGLSYSITY